MQKSKKNDKALNSSKEVPQEMMKKNEDSKGHVIGELANANSKEIGVAEDISKKSKIYINGELLGSCEDPEAFTQEMREKRRNGEVSHEMNITYYEDNNDKNLLKKPTFQ